MKSLTEISERKTAKIVEVKGNPHLRQRLFDMGLTKGRIVRIEKASTMGSPLLVYLMDYLLIIGLQEAKSIFVD